MPGILQSFSVVTPSGHQVDVSIAHHSSEVSTLRGLECVRCHGINYHGRRIEGCNHTICEPCMERDDSLITGEHDCHGTIVTGKTLTSYGVEARTLLDNLMVFCPVNECNQQARLSVIDQHISSHAVGEIRVANDQAELPPGVLWYEHQGSVYYMADPDAP